MPNEQKENKPQETPQDSKPQEKPTEVKPVELKESFANKSGDQGVFFNPTVGINTPDPFAPQDVTPSQSPTSQIVPPPPVQPLNPPAQSSGSDSSDSGE